MSVHLINPTLRFEENIINKCARVNSHDKIDENDIEIKINYWYSILV